MSTTQELEWTYIDKSKWPEGQWNSEPDKLQWIDEATGLDCLIVRAPHSGHLCGYVGVPEGHKLFGKDDQDVEVTVHGGLTFSGKCNESDKEHGICHRPFPGRPDHVWWLGFDCAHLGDISPESIRRFDTDYHATYKTVHYVKGQCRELAKQLA